MDKPLRSHHPQNQGVATPTNSFIPFPQEEAEQSIPDRFEQQVRSYPDHLAIRTSTYQMTYERLNQEANRAAWAILAQRQESDVPLLLLLEPGAAFLIATLGALKAGKFYVPLDPSHPPARLIAMHEDSQATLLLTNNQNLHLASELAQRGCQVINIDELASHPITENPRLSIPQERLACIIYTSGSTGRPKGVVHSHRTMVHAIRNYTNVLHISAMDRLSLLYSPSVIGAIRTIFLALLNGATLMPFDVKKEGLAQIAPWLIQEEITFYRSIPTVFRHFVRTLTAEETFPKLRMIWLGGEPIYWSDVELYKTYFPEDCRLVCGLGSTETFTYRWNFIDKKTPIATGTVPPGYAVGDTEVLVVDEHGNEVGVNGIGEIVVKSPNLALGYWRQPDRTREVFHPDPNGGNARLYYTGDMGRISPDGCLEHLGRKDFQVKIRGYRIEITEIETALRSHPAIAEAVVVARQHEAGEPYLVAYLVPRQQMVPSVGEVRHFVQERLPEYMVPSAYVALEALPLTPNGKVDRLALPEPDQARPELEQTSSTHRRPALRTPYVAPRNEVERSIADIWRELLGIHPVGVHDNFLDLGGHSLMALQVISRLRRAFQVEIPVHVFLDAPTVAGLAAAIETAKEHAPQADPEEIAQLLAMVEGLPDEEIQRLLTDSAE